MPLTLTVVLEDDELQEFVDRYNADAGIKITTDRLAANNQFQHAIVEDMISEWLLSLTNADYASPYDLYSDCFEGPQRIHDSHVPDTIKLYEETEDGIVEIPAADEVEPFVGDSDHEH